MGKVMCSPGTVAVLQITLLGTNTRHSTMASRDVRIDRKMGEQGSGSVQEGSGIKGDPEQKHTQGHAPRVLDKVCQNLLVPP
jgi:hypothetical protein